MTTKRYLITGGGGFIGSHLADRLLAAGHSVVIIDNLSTGKRSQIPAEAELIVNDITTPGIFHDIVGKVDGCFHLAAIVSVQQSTREWLRLHQVNLGGMVALYDALARHSSRIPVVFASSAAVYGNSHHIPLLETAHCAPLSAYGADKRACELHAGVATHMHGIPTAGLRFFNVYGPRQDPDSQYSGVISIFTSAMQQHKPVRIFGDGNQSRDFIYVADVVAGLVQAMAALENKQFAHAILNICTGTQTSINTLANMIAGITHSHSLITYAAPSADDIRVSLGDPELSDRLLGFKALVSLQDGLQRTLKML